MLEYLLRKIAQVAVVIAIGFGIFFAIGSKKIEHSPESVKYRYKEVRSPFDNKIYALKIPEKMDFAGEDVPLNETDVRERLDRELLINAYWHSQTLYIMKQYSKQIKFIEPILERNGIPHDFIYLCIAESGLQYNALSGSGAVGLWQFMKPTAQKYDLLINEEVDERMNYEMATEAACKYLKEGKDRFGNWTMAAASFNMGMDGLDKVSRIQGTKNYFHLYLNKETSRYIYRILAIKEILNNPTKYGFFLESDDLYSSNDYKTITVDSSIHKLISYATKISVYD